MTAVVICVASAKGGSGKTNLTATFATVLSATGKKVLIIDCDESTHGLTLLHIDAVSGNSSDSPKQKRRGIFDWLRQDESPPKPIQLPSGVWLIPATYRFERKPPQTGEVFHDHLRATVQSYRGNFDYIFLDAQAGADVLSQAAMSKDVSDYVVVVSEYDPLSAAGVERLKAIMGDHLSYERTWILLNKMLPEFIKSFTDFFSIANYLPPIPWSADVVRAYARRELALNLKDGNEFTLAIIRTLKALPIPNLRSSLDAWAELQASMLREPIHQQYSDSETILESIYKQLKERRSRRQLLDIIPQLLILITTFSVVSYIAFPQVLGDSLRTTPSWELLVTVVIILLSALLGWAYFRSRFDSNLDPVMRRLERQREIFEEKLKRLEVIREGDFESIVRGRPRDATSERGLDELG